MPLARPPSTCRTAIPISVMTAPPISIRWVGPQSVTSWPNSRCQPSSSGNPASAKAPAAQISTPPSGACQSRVIRSALPPIGSRGRKTAMQPALKIPNRPTRIR